MSFWNLSYWFEIIVSFDQITEVEPLCDSLIDCWHLVAINEVLQLDHLFACDGNVVAWSSYWLGLVHNPWISSVWCQPNLNCCNFVFCVLCRVGLPGGSFVPDWFILGRAERLCDFSVCCQFCCLNLGFSFDTNSYSLWWRRVYRDYFLTFLNIKWLHPDQHNYFNPHYYYQYPFSNLYYY